MDRLLEQGYLRGKAEDEAPSLDIKLLLQALEQQVVDTSNQEVELAWEILQRISIGGPALVERERHAPGLLAIAAAEAVEERHETGEAIDLGDDEVDRNPQTKGFLEFAQAPPDGASEVKPLRRRRISELV